MDRKPISNALDPDRVADVRARLNRFAKRKAAHMGELKQRLTTLSKASLYDVRVSWQEPDDDGPPTMPCPSCETTVPVEYVGTVETTGSKHTACATYLEAPIVGLSTGFRHYRLAEVKT